MPHLTGIGSRDYSSWFETHIVYRYLLNKYGTVGEQKGLIEAAVHSKHL
jgi:hypothetical protein